MLFQQQSNITPSERRKILVIGRPAGITDVLADYAIQLSERLESDLFIVAILDNMESNDNSGVHETVTRGPAKEALRIFKQKAARKNIRCNDAIWEGNMEKAAEFLLQSVKRTVFVLTDSEYTKNQLSEDITIPVFSLSTTYDLEGTTMTRENKEQRKSDLKKTIGYGLLSACLYGLVFWKPDTVMHYFTKGGFYAALPVATVIVFSFAHGAFASSLWSLIGIKPLKKDALQPADSKSIGQSKKLQKRPRAYAYINPFHKI